MVAHKVILVKIKVDLKHTGPQAIGVLFLYQKNNYPNKKPLFLLKQGFFSSYFSRKRV